MRASWQMLVVFAAAAVAALAVEPIAYSEWSPERAELLFVSTRDGDSDIYLRGADGELRNLSDHPGLDNWPMWSPDGERIVFQSNRSGNLDIWLMQADGSGQRQLTDHEAADYLPAWSPDGSRIGFTSWRQQPEEAKPQPHIYVMLADGSQQRRLLAESPGTSSGAGWSPDGRRVVFSRRLDDQATELFMSDLQDGELRQLTSDGVYKGAAVFSPDGRSIAYHANRGTHTDLVLLSLEQGTERRLWTQGHNWYPQFSPDGRFITYTTAASGHENENLDVYMLPVSGGAPRLLVGGPGREAEASWRPLR